MRADFDQIVTLAERVLSSRGISKEIRGVAAKNCAWLEGCSYPGLKLLQEALGDGQRDLILAPDSIGLDLQNVSCVFLGPAVNQYVKAQGRVFLRNVRHGLYLLPLAVEANIGIGCPVDAAFALGGERHKNPYVEKLEIAARDGIAVDDALWRALEAN